MNYKTKYEKELTALQHPNKVAVMESRSDPQIQELLAWQKDYLNAMVITPQKWSVLSVIIAQVASSSQSIIHHKARLIFLNRIMVTQNSN
jgi:hypothetical protein